MNTPVDILNSKFLPQLDIEPIDEQTAVEPYAVHALQDAERLQRLVGLGLETLEEILEQPTPPLHHANYTKMLSIKKDTAVSVVNLSLKADENRFRKRQNDVLGELLANVKAEKEKRAPITIDQRP